MLWTRFVPAAVAVVAAAAVGAALVYGGGLALCVACVSSAGAALLVAARRREARRGAAEPAPDGVGETTYTWWMHPAVLAVWMGTPALLMAWLISAPYFKSHWGTPKYFTTHYLLIGLLFLAVFAVGAMLAAPRVRARASEAVSLDESQLDLLSRAASLLFWLAVTGYSIWLVLAVVRGGTVADVRAILAGHVGAASHGKATFLKPVAGVTSLTQVGPVAAVCLVLLWRTTGVSIRRKLGLLLAFTVVRTVLDAERLALLEVLVPVAVILLVIPPRGRREQEPRARRWARVMFPLLLPVMILLVFGTFEYGRSWSGHYRSDGQKTSYLSFTADRVVGYYATAENNSVIAIDTDARTERIPYYTLQWFWTFPALGRVLDYAAVAGADPSQTWMQTLAERANPEFNNQGGLLTVVVDYGVAGGVVFWFALGCVFGVVYGRARAGSAGALIAYAVSATGLFEIARIFYWGLGRSFPTLVAAIVVGVALGRAGARGFHPTSGLVAPANGLAPCA